MNEGKDEASRSSGGAIPSDAARRVIDAIRNGLPGPYEEFPHNGQVWRNDEGNLPAREDPDYYTQWSVPGQERLVSGKEGEVFFSPDHGRTFYRYKE